MRHVATRGRNYRIDNLIQFKKRGSIFFKMLHIILQSLLNNSKYTKKYLN